MLNIFQDIELQKLIFFIVFMIALGWPEVSLYKDEKRNNKKGAKYYGIL